MLDDDDDENWLEGYMLSSGKGGFKLPPTFQFRLIIKVECKNIPKVFVFLQ